VLVYAGADPSHVECVSICGSESIGSESIVYARVNPSICVTSKGVFILIDVCMYTPFDVTQIEGFTLAYTIDSLPMDSLPHILTQYTYKRC
jgi:hypothetical protein